MRRSTILFCISVFAMFGNSAHAATYDTLVKFGSTWKYLDDGTSQDATTWKMSSFADATWDSGAGPLGFGDSWITTCIDPGCISIIPCTPVCLNINITDYFRKKITIPATAVYEDSVKVFAQVDDGIVMYVNGTQVWSKNMPATLNSSTPASSTINGSDESKIDSITIPRSVFTNGANEVAVELHQHGGTTSDATFDMMMRFKRKPVIPSVVSDLDRVQQFSVSPNPSKGDFSISCSDLAFDGTAGMTIFDITGRQIVVRKILFASGKAAMRLDAPAGIYFVRMNAGAVSASFRLTIE